MTGFHDSMGRVGPFAVVDIALTLAAAYPVGKMAGVPYWVALLALLLVGEGLHLLLKLKTPVTELVTDAN